VHPFFVWKEEERVIARVGSDHKKSQDMAAPNEFDVIAMKVDHFFPVPVGSGFGYRSFVQVVRSWQNL